MFELVSSIPATQILCLSKVGLGRSYPVVDFRESIELSLRSTIKLFVTNKPKKIININKETASAKLT